MRVKILLISILNFQILLGNEEWYKIPFPIKRWGISYLNISQNEKGNLKSANVDLNKLNLDFENPKSLDVKADLNLIKVDYFLLPFFNIYGIGGEIDTEASFNLGKGVFSIDSTGKPGFDSIIDNILKPINKNMPDIRIKQKSKGDIYGGGILLGCEYRNIFTSLQYTYTQIKLDGNLATKDAQVGTGRVGYNYKYNDNIKILSYFALSYQKTDANISGVIPETNFDYNFNVELEKYTPSFGIFFSLPKNFTFLVDYAWGEKELLAMELGYRF